MGHYETLRTEKFGTNHDLYLVLKAKLMHKKSTEEVTIIGIPPITIISNGNNATVGLKGNMSQSGTPTPDSPVMPNGTGERTVNLFNKESLNIINNRYQRYNGELDASSNHIVSDFMLISGTHITISNTSVDNTTSQCFYDDNKNFISSFKLNEIPKTIEIPSNAKFIRCTVPKTRRDDFMLNLGSEALPYEPYGYKIPISCGGTTTPVYLGEVQTVRQIRKLVLTGQETFGYANSCFTLTFDGQSASVQPKKEIIFCNVYDGRAPVYRDQLRNYQCCITRNYNQLAIRDDNHANESAFKTYLQQQYANGTPVTVWYVLATPETAVVNEPLMRIGDYADEISGTTIPTIKGTNIVDVDTEIKPSEISITYTKGKEISINNISDMENLTIADLEKMTIAELEG